MPLLKFFAAFPPISFIFRAFAQATAAVNARQKVMAVFYAEIPHRRFRVLVARFHQYLEARPCLLQATTCFQAVSG